MAGRSWFRNVHRVLPGSAALVVMLIASAGVVVLVVAQAGAGGSTPGAAPALTRSAGATTLLSETVPAPEDAGVTARPGVAPEKKGAGTRGGKSGAPCSAVAKACVDLSSQQAWLTDGAGHITYGPVAARGGGKHAKTPKGSFSVIWKDEHHLSKQFNNAPMPYSVFFYPGDAFHGGNPATASNGCIHLAIGAARRFFTSLNPGDKVEIR